MVLIDVRFFSAKKKLFQSFPETKHQMAVVTPSLFPLRSNWAVVFQRGVLRQAAALGDFLLGNLACHPWPPLAGLPWRMGPQDGRKW